MPDAQEKTAAEDSKAPKAGRSQRQRAVQDFKRNVILEAARTAFVEDGLEGASLRSIAKRAGYTPGAVYLYFDSKEAIYAAILEESLARLDATIEAKAEVALPGRMQAAQALMAYADYYSDHPVELDLGLYLYQADKKGLTPELDAHLNACLSKAIDRMVAATTGHMGDEGEARKLVLSFVAHVVGALVLKKCGRLKLFEGTAENLITDQLNMLLDY
ncbi:TetR/AcrR family transcriptional regulator [Rhodovibrionaceae bacterium A322]